MKSKILPSIFKRISRILQKYPLHKVIPFSVNLNTQKLPVSFVFLQRKPQYLHKNSMLLLAALMKTKNKKKKYIKVKVLSQGSFQRHERDLRRGVIFLKPRMLKALLCCWTLSWVKPQKI